MAYRGIKQYPMFQVQIHIIPRFKVISQRPAPLRRKLKVKTIRIKSPEARTRQSVDTDIRERPTFVPTLILAQLWTIQIYFNA